MEDNLHCIVTRMEEGSILRSHLMPGQLVSITIDKKRLGDVEFATTGKSVGHHVFFESIRLSTWPGWNDFFGHTVPVHEGDIAVVMQKIGRPDQIHPHPRWALYDVYELLIDNKICQAFRCNLIPISAMPHQLGNAQKQNS